MGEYYAIISRDLTQKIRKSSILYLMQDQHSVMICMDRGDVSVRGKVRELAGKLGDRFYLAHQYCAVNMDRIEKMTDAKIFFDSGQVLSIGYTNYARLRKQFVRFLVATCCD